MASKPNMFEYRWDQLTKAGDKDISDPRLYLRGAGAITGLFGDMAAYPVEKIVGAITPDSVKRAFKQGADWVVNETDAGKAVLKLAKDNPEYAKDIMDGLNIAGSIPLLKIFGKAGITGIKKALEQSGGVKPRVKAGAGGAIGSSSISMATARNMPTLQQGGMFGDVLDIGRTVKGTGDNLRTYSQIAKGMGRTPRTGLNFYSGGFGNKVLSTAGEALRAFPKAVKELTSPKELASYRMTGMSSNARKKELPKAITPLESSGTHAMQSQMKLQNDGVYAPLNDIDSPLMIKARLAEFNLLDANSVSNINKVMFKGVPEDIATRHLNHIKAVHGIDGKKPATLSIKPPKTNGIARELLGTGSTGPRFIKSLTQGNLMAVYKKAHKIEKIDPRGMVEITQISLGITKDVAKQMSKKLKVKESNHQNLIETVIKARAKINTRSNVPLSKREANVLKAWQELDSPIGTVRDVNGKIVSSKKFGDIPEIKGNTLTSSDSYLSKSKELGGVNYIITHDLKGNRSYVTMSDGSDLFGIGGGPKNAPDIVVATPTQEIIWGSKNTVTLKSGKKLPQRFNTERTNQTRKNEKKILEQGTRELEERSGIKKGVKETPVKYQKRVLTDFEAKPTARDYRQAFFNQVKIGTAATQSNLKNKGLFEDWNIPSLPPQEDDYMEQYKQLVNQLDLSEGGFGVR